MKDEIGIMVKELIILTFGKLTIVPPNILKIQKYFHFYKLLIRVNVGVLHTLGVCILLNVCFIIYKYNTRALAQVTWFTIRYQHVL